MSTLYVIATPIGNLEDISLRALRILKEEVEIIYCEDTRITIKLLNHYQIQNKKLISFNKDNEVKRVEEILYHLDSGNNIAICSDAGTPLISDPGFSVISELDSLSRNLADGIFRIGSKHTIVPLPGASALTTALSVCPIDTSRFVFEGFLPQSPQKRRRVLKAWLNEERPIVFFESPYRVLKCLEDIKNIFGIETQIFIARELSKKFEQFYSGTIIEIIQELQTQFPKDVQGEFVIVIARDK